MFTKTKLALVGALVFGLGTMAQAGSKDDAEHEGGYRLGPLSQRFAGVNPASHRSLRGRMYARGTNGREAYGFVPRSRASRPVGEETYIRVQDRDFRRSNGIRHRDGNG